MNVTLLPLTDEPLNLRRGVAEAGDALDFAGALLLHGEVLARRHLQRLHLHLGAVGGHCGRGREIITRQENVL